VAGGSSTMKRGLSIKILNKFCNSSKILDPGSSGSPGPAEPAGPKHFSRACSNITDACTQRVLAYSASIRVNSE